MKTVIVWKNFLLLGSIYFLMYFFENPITMIAFGALMGAISGWMFPVMKVEHDEQEKE